MFAIVEIDGKQYKVCADQTLEVNALTAPDNQIVIDKVLMAAEDDKVEIGHPYLNNVRVEARILKPVKGKKIRTYLYRRRKDSHRKIGHRQKLTRILITNINKS